MIVIFFSTPLVHNCKHRKKLHTLTHTHTMSSSQVVREAARRCQLRRAAERHCDHTTTTRKRVEKVVSFSEVVECSDETLESLKYEPELDESYLELKQVAESLKRQLDGGDTDKLQTYITVWNTLDLQEREFPHLRTL